VVVVVLVVLVVIVGIALSILELDDGCSD